MTWHLTRKVERRLPTFGILVMIGSLYTSACQPQPSFAQSAERSDFETSTPDASLSKEITESLLAPGELPHIFWRQKLSFRYQDREFSFEAVIENDGFTFKILALGPVNTRLFLITQVGQKVEFKKFLDREINLDPEKFLFDMQRALFWFPLQNEDIREETDRGRFVHGSFRGFISDDQWRGPGIVRRCIANEPGPTTFTLRNQCLEISYDPAFRPGAAPVLVELKDQNQGYTLMVEQLQNGQIP